MVSVRKLKVLIGANIFLTHIWWVTDWAQGRAGRGLLTVGQPDPSALHDHWLDAELARVNREGAARCTQSKLGFNLLRITWTVPPESWKLSSTVAAEGKSKDESRQTARHLQQSVISESKPSLVSALLCCLIVDMMFKHSWTFCIALWGRRSRVIRYKIYSTVPVSRKKVFNWKINSE